MARLIKGSLGPVLAQKAKTGGMRTRVVQANARGPLGKTVVPAPSSVHMGLSPDGMSPSYNGREETDVHDIRKERDRDRGRETERQKETQRGERNTKIVLFLIVWQYIVKLFPKSDFSKPLPHLSKPKLVFMDKCLNYHNCWKNRI